MTDQYNQKCTKSKTMSYSPIGYIIHASHQVLGQPQLVIVVMI